MWNEEDIAVMSNVSRQSNLWTDGRDEDPHAQVGFAGAWCLLFLRCLGCLMAESGVTFKVRIRRRMLPGFFPRSTIPYRRFIVRSIWGVILVLRTLMSVHLVIDNKNVCDMVGRLLDDRERTPFCFYADGDLVACISGMLRCRSQG